MWQVFSNKGRVMELETISKNEASPKSQMSRGNFLRGFNCVLFSLIMILNTQSLVAQSLVRENEAKQIENEGAVLARQTSDYNKAQAIKLTTTSLANKIRNGEITLAQAQAQLRGSQTQQSNQTQQGIQVAGWYYKNPQYGNQTKTTVRLTVQRRETGQVYPQYLILSIDGQRQSATPIATYDRNTGLYVFNWGNTKVYFNM